ncbi:hypothetical protein [Glaciimonas immobilis]|uniref:Uncharacterized protein n=1 Tax=Glaciimonas immobilis TaxID=728004 RepID=A0A840RPK5_9BURK|nr:hypothetical protein [Glaciimonas immobilis]KAF3999533.1 hypothetical protein HAV38_06375 [Glaciimonas immobilis]MBB5199072.1 hypothetical protein [Glaciimonas immobilis]
MTSEHHNQPALESAHSGDDAVIPSSIFRGKLKINGIAYECHVLNDFRRAFSSKELTRLLTAGEQSVDLLALLEVNPLINNALVESNAFTFKITGMKQHEIGYDALIVIEILEKYLEAWERDLLSRANCKSVDQAISIARTCLRVGLMAMIDDATGFLAHKTNQTMYVKMEALKMLTIAKG